MSGRKLGFLASSTDQWSRAERAGRSCPRSASRLTCSCVVRRWTVRARCNVAARLFTPTGCQATAAAAAGVSGTLHCTLYLSLSQHPPLATQRPIAASIAFHCCSSHSLSLILDPDRLRDQILILDKHNNLEQVLCFSVSERKSHFHIVITISVQVTNRSYAGPLL